MWTQPQTWRSLPALWLSPALLPCHSWLLLPLLGFPVCGDWEWTRHHDIYRAKINQRKESYPVTEWNIFLLLHVLIMLPLNLFLLTPLFICNITLWFCQDSLWDEPYLLEHLCQALGYHWSLPSPLLSLQPLLCAQERSINFQKNHLVERLHAAQDAA